MVKTLCIGNASYDISVVMDDFLKENDDLWLDKKIGCGGGTASTVAYSLAKWGVNTTFGGVIGNDANGNRIKQEMSEVNIDTRFIEMSFEKDTNMNIKMIKKGNGSSTNLTLADEFSKLKKHDYDFSPDLIFADGYDCYATKNAISKYPKALTLLKLNYATKEIMELTKYVKNVICSLPFAEKVSGTKADINNPSSLAAIYYKTKARIPNAEVVITLGEYGALYCANNEIKISPALKNTVVDTNGAGDVFAAAYAFVLLAGGDMEKSIKYGNIAASLTLNNVGIRKSIPSIDQVEKLYVQNYE